MTHRGAHTAAAQDSSFEETMPMNDLLGSIRHMVDKEEAALLHLQQLTAEVNQIADNIALRAQGKIVPETAQEVHSPLVREELIEEVFEDNDLREAAIAHAFEKRGASIGEDKNESVALFGEEEEISPEEKQQDTLSLEQEISSVDDLESPEDSESSFLSAPEEEKVLAHQNPVLEGRDDEEQEDFLPLPGLDGLAELAEDFLTEDGDPSPARRFSSNYEGEKPLPSPPAFLQEYAALTQNQSQILGSLHPQEPVLNLTTVVNPDGSVHQTAPSLSALSQEVTAQFLQNPPAPTGEDALLARAMETVVGRIAAPLIEKWLAENVPHILRRMMEE